MNFARAGLTGLNNNSSQSFPIGSWGLDDLIVQQATMALNGRFQVAAGQLQPSRLCAVKDSPIAPSISFVAIHSRSWFRLKCRRKGSTAYIVITKAKSNFGRGARKVEGIGFLTYGTVLASYNQIHALYEITVFDGKTFDVIEKGARRRWTMR